ncbi:hypothetical protein ALC60_00825 [Trachymyrmex zeteki]|uniref:Uncharacterized protein n=1 Tax=Mycetomoellerius zeteki TaxID=64791 RepID=A0A151XJA5_9HYME|nr:hypothetical protein ALC60_00825 [Trachymyrmex zeteki]
MLMVHVIPAGCQVQVETGCGRVLAAAGLGASRVAAVAGLLVGRQAHRRLRRRNLRALLTSESCDGFNEGLSDAEIVNIYFARRYAPQFKTRKIYSTITIYNAYIMLPICVRFAECRLLSRSRHANCNTSVWDTGAYAGAVRDSLEVVREFDAKKSNLPNN